MNYLKNKKVIIISILVIILIGIVIFINNREENSRESKKLIEKNYTMYIKINPLIKLTFKEKYYECNKNICSDKKNEVLEYTLINDDAKTIWKNVDIEGKSLEESLTLLLNKAKENNIEFNKVEIISDYVLDQNKLINEIKKIINKEITITSDYQNVINESDVIKILEGKANKFTVTFDSKGGSEIPKQIVIENGIITKPKNPERKGYTFLSWTLNNKEFNFETKITNDITLEAVWKLNQTEKPSNNNQEQIIVKSPTLQNVTKIMMENEGHYGNSELVDGKYGYDLGIDKSAYRPNPNEYDKYSVSGYVIYEKSGTKYTEIEDVSMTGSEVVYIQVSPGERKEYVARVYAKDKNGKKVYSEYSNIIVIDHTSINSPTLNNVSKLTAEEEGKTYEPELVDGKYGYDLGIDKRAYRPNPNEYDKYSVSGYVIYEKSGTKYTEIEDVSMTGSEVVYIQVSPGERKEYVARVYAKDKNGKKVYSEYSNVIIIDHR